MAGMCALCVVNASISNYVVDVVGSVCPHEVAGATRSDWRLLRPLEKWVERQPVGYWGRNQMVVSINGGTPKWLVYSGKAH